MRNAMSDTMILKAGLGPEVRPAAKHRVVAICGDPRAHSRTGALASAVAIRLARDLLGGSRPDASWRLIETGASATPSHEEVDSVAGADLVVVATPIRRGSYSGQLKLFIDGLPDKALAGAIAIPVAVARTPRHALAAEVHLRPLLQELGASCPTPSLFALESRLSNPGAVCGAWFERARPALMHLAPAGA
jgi:FMN reductase